MLQGHARNISKEVKKSYIPRKWIDGPYRWGNQEKPTRADPTHKDLEQDI